METGDVRNVLYSRRLKKKEAEAAYDTIINITVSENNKLTTHLHLDYQDFYLDDTSELFSCMPYESATK